jgi:hypothetical protein
MPSVLLFFFSLDQHAYNERLNTCIAVKQGIGLDCFW